MRNLKRALSLTLASVMLLGMMVIGTSAAVGYSDVDADDNVEAIEVLQAVEVMVGDDRGFGPDRPVTRAEMAVVMGKLLNLDYNYYVSTCPFADVSGNFDWAKGWVGACAANGIVSGRGDGIYDPAATVTAVEAASMMMRALGYFRYQNDYADGFMVSTVRQGTKIGLFEGVGSDAATPMTRNQVAQMALNALKSGMVEPDGNTINLTTPDGAVFTGKVNYVFVTSAKPYATAISPIQATAVGSQNGGPIVELGEQLYNGKLKLTEDNDVFGRPSRKWEYDGKGVGVYAKKELLDKEYVGEVTGKDLYDLLGSTTLKDYDTFCFVDGVYTDAKGAKAALGWTSDSNMGAYFNATDMDKNKKSAVGGTGIGVKTEVYVDHDADEVYVVVINTYLAIANKDYDAKKEEAAITAYSIKKDNNIKEYVKVAKDGTETEAFKLAIETFPAAEEIKKDDALLITVADGEVQSFQAAEVLSSVTISAFKLQSKVVADGNTYEYTTTAGYKAGDLGGYTTTDITNLKDRAYNIYLDAYGNLIGVKEIEAKKNYLFLTGIDLNGSNLANQTADAYAIFLDGTPASIRVNMTKSTLDVSKNENDSILNTWCTYTKSGDVYTVKEVIKADTLADVPGGADNPTSLAQYNQTGAGKIDAKNYRLKGGNFLAGQDYSSVYGDKDTVYITGKLGELQKGDDAGDNFGIVKDVLSVTTGIENANLTIWDDATALTKAEDSKIKGTVDGAKCSSGVYTLYNKDGLIIAALVIGEDAGTGKDLVYVTSDSLELEADNGGSKSRAADDGLWTWSRLVVRNGEEVTLYEVGDDSGHSTHLRQMEQYKWYQIRTNADGNVIEALPAERALDVYNAATGASRFVKDYKFINWTVEQAGVDTVLYITEGGPNNTATNGFNTELEVKGNNTLAVTNQQGSGIHFTNDVNVVLQYWNRDKQEKDIWAGEGIDDLKDMVDIVNANNETRGDADYFVSALIENGFATSIVIYDSYNNYKRPGSGETPGATGNVVVAESFTGSKKPTMVGESKITVNAFGAPVVDFTAKVPEWASGTATFDYDLYVNGTIALAGQRISPALTIDADQEVTVNNKILSIGGALKSSDSVRLEITDATYSHVKATYVDQDGNDISDKLTAASVAPATIATDRATGTDVKLKLDASKFGTLTGAKLTGLTGLTNTTEASSVLQVTDGTVDMMAAGGETKLATGGATNNYVAALGTSAVEVEITLTGATPKPVTYSVTGQTTPDALNDVTLDDYPGFPAANTTDGAIKLTWTFTGATNVNAGSAAVVKVKAASALTEAYKYYLSGTIAGKEFKVELKATDASINISALNSNFEVKAADLTVTAVPKLAVTKASWDTNKAVFEFNCNVDKTTAETVANWTLTDTSTGSAAIAFVEAAGNRVTVFFDGTKNAVDATDTLAITATIEQDGESGNKTTATTFTFKADGVVNDGANDLPTA